MPQNTN